MEEVGITIIGAGVVGLAIAAELSARHQVLVLEKNDKYGQETSSRNSEVIHAGIYYPQGTLKATLCVQGNRLLYDICAANRIGHKRLGKVIVATVEEELAELDRLLECGRRNGAELRMLSADEVHELEPNVNAVGGVYSPNTGIIDSHGLMKYYLARLLDNDGQIAYASPVVGIDRTTSGFAVTVNQAGEAFCFGTRVLINAAGLHSDHMASLAGIDIDQAGYRLHYCKGEYFCLAGSPTQRLVYPVPETHGAGLGVHVTIDLQGRARLGPNSQYVNNIDYSVDEDQKETFFQSARKLLPQIARDDIGPDMAGIRPKLQGPGQAFRDFVIRREDQADLQGLINLIGIESPGLTASPAIARYVAELVEQTS